MGRSVQGSPFKKADEYSRSDFALAVTSREEAIQRNEFFKAHGIAAEQEVKADGERMALVFRDRSGRREAHRAFGVLDRDGGYGDHCGE